MEKSKAGDIITNNADKSFYLKSWFKSIQNGKLDPILPVPTGLLQPLFLLEWWSVRIQCTNAYKVSEECIQLAFLHAFMITLKQEAMKCLRSCELFSGLFWDFWVSLNSKGCWQNEFMLKAFVISNKHNLAEVLLSEHSHSPLACRAAKGWKQYNFLRKM